MVAEPSTSVVRGVVTAFQLLAIISTTFRLGYRVKTKRFWWDDGFALVALMLTIVNLVALWIRSDVKHRSHSARTVAYWLLTLGFTCILWSCRMSMILTIIRITPRITIQRRFAVCSAYLFALIWIALLIQKTYICGHDLSWYHLAKPQCHLGTAVGITELTTDIVSDIILIALPFHLLWDLSTSRTRYRLLMAIFSASILTTVTAVSLIVCSLGVIVTYIYRALGLGQDSSDDEVYVSSDRGNSTSRRGGRSSMRKPGQGVISALHFARDTHVGVDSVGVFTNRNDMADPMMLKDLRVDTHSRSDIGDAPPGFIGWKEKRAAMLINDSDEYSILGHSKKADQFFF
ncbi:hypothetical protein EW146_g6073 [Bondarzewia mesenterica]|uniref:Rhodopsin domain-containing protein n=1 Tax=Bondarzewia mesenterica TaxID=1095465 RepID=A0A4S4LRP3_9AGAM|nr:hypothetical protein EW146_g6073 [Bondarzewia mesenterica]